MTRIVFILIAIYFFLHSVLTLFPWTRYASRTLLGYALNPLTAMGRSILDYLPNLFFLIILYGIFRILFKLLHAFFNEVDRSRIKIPAFDPDWAWPTYRIMRVLLIILGVVIAYPYIPGSGSEAFKGISILVGVLFSLGSTSLIANIIAGYTMTYRRAFKVGDRVQIGSNIGEVTQIYSDLHKNILDVFNQYDVAIMTPHYTGDTPDAKLVPREQWHTSPAQKNSGSAD